MSFTGVLVNTGTVIVGSLLGLLFKKGKIFKKVSEQDLLDTLIEEIEKLYGDQAKVKKMSESAAKLHLSDTNDRILTVIESLMARGKNELCKQNKT